MTEFENIKPVYLDLPSWNIDEVAGVTDFKKLPKSAKQYLEFLQEVTGLPITFATTGPKREDVIIF